MASNRFSRLLSLAGWAGMAGGLVVSGLGLSAFVAPDYWFSDNMSFFLRQFLGAEALGLLAALLGLCVSHRWPRGYKTTFVVFAAAYLLLAGLTTGRILANASPTIEPDGHSTIRIASINLEQLYLEDETLTRYLRDIDADILVFQEVGWWWQKKRLARLNRWDDGSLPVHRYGGELGDIVVFSKFPIKTARTHIVEGDPSAPHDAPNEILSLDLSINGQLLQLIAVHPASPRSRQQWDDRQKYFSELVTVTENAIARSKTPTVLIGDWNLSPWSSHFVSFLERFDLGTAFESSIPQTTRFFFDYRLRWFLGAIVDHVAISEDLDISEVKLGPDIGSDHVPLVVDILMPFSASGLRNTHEISSPAD